ncbi:MAG: amidohydrolase family protein [Caldiserica bacterium]|nr:amidohydrolase family protein [Caldisericota bacterium]
MSSTTTMNKLLIKNGTLLTMGGDRQPLKADLLVADGRIKRIDTAIGRGERPDVTIDASGMIVLPGLIFGHARLGLSLLRGQTDQILDDAERERTALRLVGGLSPEQVRCSAELGICQAIRSGVTTLFEGGSMRHTDQIFQAARTLGFRLIGGRLLADRTLDWPETLRMSLREQMSDGQALAHDIASSGQGGLLRYGVSTTNPLFCTDECLTQAKAFADAGGYPLKIVLTTDKSQIERMRRESGPQELASLETLGVLGENTFLVNPSFASELEQNVIRKAGARVVINVTADLKLGRPLSRLPEFVRKGTPVLPGFDSPVYGGRMDAVRELAVLATAFRPQYGPQTMTPEQVLSMVTVDAARALDMEEELGTLEPGKRADMVLVDLGRDMFAQPGAHTNVYCRLVYEASTNNIACTIIDGRIVYRDGRVIGCDEEALVEQANAELVRILEKA